MSKLSNNISINGKINYIYNKFIIVPNTNNIKDYYSITTGSKNYQSKLIQKYDIKQLFSELDENEEKTFRNPWMDGNSSSVGTSLKAFKEEEKIYMKILLYNNCFLEESTFNLDEIINKLKKIDSDDFSSENDSDVELFYKDIFKENNIKQL